MRSGSESSIRDPIAWLSGLLLVPIFVVDTQVPWGVAGGMPYIAVVLLAGQSRHRALPYVIAAAATVLTVVGGLLSPEGAAFWIGAANRTMALSAIWIVAYLAYWRNAAEALRVEAHLENEIRLAEANRDLESFSQSLSHDLRNQLAPIILSADLLEKGYGHCLNDEGRRLLRSVGIRGRRMLALMEDLLDLATLGRLEPPEHPVDVEEVVTGVLENLEAEIREAGIDIVRHPLAGVQVPDTLLGAVFGNLLTNALRYSGREGKPIEIGSEADPTVVRYFVRDHGPGIPPDEREAVFERFLRGSTDRGTGGAGIGLAIVRRVAELYEGRAWVAETPGGGATFFVELPTRTPARERPTMDGCDRS